MYMITLQEKLEIVFRWQHEMQLAFNPIDEDDVDVVIDLDWTWSEEEDQGMVATPEPMPHTNLDNLFTRNLHLQCKLLYVEGKILESAVTYQEELFEKEDRLHALHCLLISMEMDLRKDQLQGENTYQKINSYDGQLFDINIKLEGIKQGIENVVGDII